MTTTEVIRYIWPLPPEQVRATLLSEMDGIINTDFLRRCNVGKQDSMRIGIMSIMGAGVETTFTLTAVEAAMASDTIKSGVWLPLAGSLVPDKMRVKVRCDVDNGKFKIVFYQGREWEAEKKLEIDEKLCGPTAAMRTEVAGIKSINGDEDAKSPDSQAMANMALECWRYLQGILQARKA